MEEEMICPIRLTPLKCDKCPFGKDGACDYPYVSTRRVDIVEPKPRSSVVAEIAFRQRFDEFKDDIANGRLTFRIQPPEWTEQLLNITALSCALLKIAEEAKWN